MKKIVNEQDYIITLTTKVTLDCILIESTIIHKDYEKITDKLPPGLEGTYVLPGSLVQSTVKGLEVSVSRVFNTALLEVNKVTKRIEVSTEILSKLGFTN